MNQRLQELATEAAKYSAVVALPTGQSGDQLFVKRFAELIVKECGVALSPMLRDMVSRGQAYELIQKHFGVE